MKKKPMKNVDRLSMLPDEILAWILSLMPAKFSVRTSVLSKRCRYTWTLVRNLYFHDDILLDNPSFPELVHQVLKLCNTSEINLFRLSLSSGTRAQNPNVSDWIDMAVRLNVRELHITSFARHINELPVTLFTCNTLTKLTIAYPIWEYPYPVHLPSLKTLDFVICSYPIDHALQFISGCPILECLSLIISPNLHDTDYTFNIPTLKRLQLRTICDQSNIRVVLKAPNLEYLFLAGFLFPFFVKEAVSSLLEVEASVFAHDTSTDHVWAELLKGVRRVKSLSIRNIPSGSVLPSFPNLKRLELKSRWRSRKIKILQFLESCPELEHLCIEEHVGFHLLKPKYVPTCLLTNFTTIKISNFKGSKCDIKFLGYVLGNAKALKTVTIIWVKSKRIGEKEHQLCTQLLKLTRASKCCEIKFQGGLKASVEL